MTAATPPGSGTGTVVVLGATSPLGEMIVRRFHSEGRQLVLADRDVEAVDVLVQALGSGDGVLRGVRADPSRNDDVVDLLDIAVAHAGPVEVVVNAAELIDVRGLMEITPAELDRVMAYNANGAFLVCQVFGAYFAERGYGRIVSIASNAGQGARTIAGGHYAVSKAAVIATTRLFAAELAGRNVTVNAVSPGPLDLPHTRALIGAEAIDRFEDALPVKRLGDPGFIAEIVHLLSSPAAASVTGACWDVTGGLVRN